MVAKLTNIRATFVSKLTSILSDLLSAAREGACLAPDGCFSFECNILLFGSLKKSMDETGLRAYLCGTEPCESINSIVQKSSTIKIIAHGCYDENQSSWKQAEKQAAKYPNSFRDGPYYGSRDSCYGSEETVGRHASCEQYLKDSIRPPRTPRCSSWRTQFWKISKHTGKPRSWYGSEIDNTQLRLLLPAMPGLMYPREGQALY